MLLFLLFFQASCGNAVLQRRHRKLIYSSWSYLGLCKPEMPFLLLFCSAEICLSPDEQELVAPWYCQTVRFQAAAFIVPACITWKKFPWEAHNFSYRVGNEYFSWQGIGTRWSLSPLPIQIIQWFIYKIFLDMSAPFLQSIWFQPHCHCFWAQTFW